MHFYGQNVYLERTFSVSGLSIYTKTNAKNECFAFKLFDIDRNCILLV